MLTRLNTSFNRIPSMAQTNFICDFKNTFLKRKKKDNKNFPRKHKKRAEVKADV